jgi:predicted RecB family nuclease
MIMTTQITQEIFEAFLKCPTKSRLYSSGAHGIESEFGKWQRRTQETYNATASKHLRSSLQANEWCIGAPPAEQLNQGRYRLIFDYVAGDAEIQARLHGLELDRSQARFGRDSYIPIRFVGKKKLAPSDRLMLAFDAFAFSRATGKLPAASKIVHGSRYSTVRVSLSKLLPKVRSVVEKIASESTKSPSPAVILNRHCTECEFQAQCRQIARDKDDLSLLSTIGDKERRKFHERGIFTVTQLSYTFRPRKRSRSGITKHFPALKALAIRQDKIHILGTPTVNGSGTPVYFDVEGDADRDFYYLIGMRSEIEGSQTQYSFWADDTAAEEKIWADFLERLKEIDRPHLIHYGSYETQFLKRMRTRYPNTGNPAFIDELARSALNLLSVIYKHVYFPAHSNSLKEIAKYLGCRWSEGGASGLNALVWRSKWEISHESQLKQKLLTYNAEDCAATQKVAEALSRACEAVLSENSPASAINANLLKREYPQRFGEIEFLLPEFQKINEAAYWDYQRNKIYVRSNRHLLRLRKKALKQGLKIRIRPNKTVVVDEERPACCYRCKGTLIYKWGRYGQTVIDLKFSPGSIKRWVVRHSFSRYICWRCKATFHLHVRKPKYGAGLCAYLLHQIIDVKISQNAVAVATRELFGLPLSRGLINHIKSSEAERFQLTYRMILDHISTGKLVHADETKVSIGGRDGYVWVFTNLEDVAFVYSETRESSTLQTVLGDFRGVLVSDFYAAYDSLECAQQKCLVHLMRDVNDDLGKQPFNEEMKRIAEWFASLLNPIIDTVDRFGLKARYLRKHGKSVAQFYEALSKRTFETEVPAGYKKRFEKNRNKLFTFLDHDGVPWNNNNAEHAIKALVKLRRSIGGQSSPRGMRDYLVLLSISQTCRYRGVSFLDFLRSGETDVVNFTRKIP